MQNEILINAGDGETRVAILERGTFVELHIERDRDRSVAGMVVLGRVSRVLPGMQAAFVDIGLEKAAFLYVGDYLEETYMDVDLDEEDPPRGRRPRGRNGNGRQMPKIESVLREGQEIVVQVAKEPIGTKGARITSHVSIAGRHLVLTPWAQRVGVSRRIESDRERRRLREIVSRIRPADLGFIIRTAGDAARETDLEADVKYLTSVWDEIQLKKEEATAPSELYTELSLPLRAIRDFSNTQTKRILVDDEQVHEEMKQFISRFVAEPKPRLERYRDSVPIFDSCGIESCIDDNVGKKVWLKSGGYLIFDQSEALTAIDVNTGRYVGKRDLEETVLKTNLEAVKEIVYQLRFRNIGGLIIMDLIDMESAENREKVYRALQEALRQDKAKTNILKISELGLVEMTRKRTRESLVRQLCEPCPHCEGRGYVLSTESVAFKLLREIRNDLPRFCGRRIAVAVNPRVAEVLLGPARKAHAALAQDLGCEIEIRARPGLHQEQFEVTALDEGPPVEIPLTWLGERRAPPQAEPALAADEKKPEESADELGADAPTGPQVGAEASPGSSPDPEPSEPWTAAPAPDPVDAGAQNRILRRSGEPEER
ncbi:MAG: Rne/Rng family ribonuclease [Myxococcota bacterium]